MEYAYNSLVTESEGFKVALFEDEERCEKN